MGTHPIFESDFDCLTENKKMNRNQPAAVIAAQQNLLEAASRQNLQNNAELQQKLQLLGKQVAAAAAANQGSAHQGITNQQLKQLSQKHQLQQMRNQSSPYARPNLIHAKPAITQKYEDLVGVIEELGKDVRPTYAGSKSAAERLKRVLHHARQLVRESQAEAEKLVRSQN